MKKFQMDSRLGRGGWRAIRRRIIFQPSKHEWRLDVANKSLTNHCAQAKPTIATTPFDIHFVTDSSPIRLPSG
eukprot:9295561-Karenia_brevis.AAC.1